LKPLAGGALILAGLALMVFGWPDLSNQPVKYEKLAEIDRGMAGFPELGGRFPADRLAHYRIGRSEGVGVDLSVAEYRDGQGRTASAIVYPPAQPDEPQGEAKLRHELWKGAADAILAHTSEDALFVSWWDDAQRIRFQSGRAPWVDRPAAGAFPSEDQRKFWRQAGGGFNPDETRLRQLAHWLSMDADAALLEMAGILPKNQPVFWLVCVDDLARLSEIEALSGVKLPFEARYFAQSKDIHSQIAEVRQWAGEKNPGSYLVQQLPSGGVRAWRMTSEEGARTLLARLLPFTTSLAKPLDDFSLVYQSGWGGYLSIYQWRSDGIR